MGRHTGRAQIGCSASLMIGACMCSSRRRGTVALTALSSESSTPENSPSPTSASALSCPVAPRFESDPDVAIEHRGGGLQAAGERSRPTQLEVRRPLRTPAPPDTAAAECPWKTNPALRHRVFRDGPRIAVMACASFASYIPACWCSRGICGPPAWCKPTSIQLSLVEHGLAELPPSVGCISAVSPRPHPSQRLSCSENDSPRAARIADHVEPWRFFASNSAGGTRKRTMAQFRWHTLRARRTWRPGGD